MVDLNHVLSNYDFVKVEEIVNHENAEPLTFYDIEVEDDHTFHIQFNDRYILSHNCDGAHICSLLINMFGVLWKEVLLNGLVYRLNTPILVAKIGKQTLEFFSIQEYEDWAKDHPKHTVKYYKGLGGWSTADFERFLTDPKYLAQIVVDEEDLELLDLIFNSSRANDRKEWLVSDEV